MHMHVTNHLTGCNAKGPKGVMTRIYEGLATLAIRIAAGAPVAASMYVCAATARCFVRVCVVPAMEALERQSQQRQRQPQRQNKLWNKGSVNDEYISSLY
jgi:hypothetical protein